MFVRNSNMNSRVIEVIGTVRIRSPGEEDVRKGGVIFPCGDCQWPGSWREGAVTILVASGGQIGAASRIEQKVHYRPMSVSGGVVDGRPALFGGLPQSQKPVISGKKLPHHVQIALPDALDKGGEWGGLIHGCKVLVLVGGPVDPGKR